MLNYLLVPLVKDFGFLRIFNYISFRAAGAAVTALLVAFVVGPVGRRHGGLQEDLLAGGQRMVTAGGDRRRGWPVPGRLRLAGAGSR